MTPEIRFKGFTQDWEQRKLGDLGSVVMNKRIFKEQTSEFGEVPFYKIGTFGKIPDAFISRTLFEEYKSKYPFPEIGDILISASGSIGRTVEYTGKDEYFQDSNIVWLKHGKQLENLFLKQFYFRVKWHGLEGSTIKRLYNKNILNTVINLPSVEEQKKIGLFFDQLDQTITLHQDKLDKLKQLKKGYLQVMFPEKDEKIPSLRFAHLFSVWEQRKFKDFITKAGKKNSKGLDYPAYSVNNKLGLVSQKEQFDGSRLEELAKTAYKIVEPDEFAYNPARINIGSIAFNHLNKTVIVSSLYVVLKMSKLLNDEYILQFVNSPEFITEVKRNTEGSVREYLFFESFKNIRFPYTNNLEEQKKLGSFFKQLDGVITLHQKKISNLQKLKKVYLQKLFV